MMTKTAWLAELEHRLRRISNEERCEALAYYHEYFDEAGEQEALKTLGTPKEAAAKIAGELALNDERGTGNRRVGVWALIGFALPVAAPVGAALIALLIVLLVVLIAVLVTVMASGAACAVNGLACLIYTLAASGSTANAALYGGFGLACAGLGLLIVALTPRLAKTLFRNASRGLAHKLIRRKQA